jgi:type I restriction enzyme S subunit
MNEASRNGQTDGEMPPEPGFKKTRVGWIPEDWCIVRLKDVISKKPDYGASASAVEYGKESSIRYVRITDIDGKGNLKDKEKAGITKEEAKGNLIQKGDILIARTGASVGKSYIHNDKYESEKMAFAGYLIRFKIDSDYCSKEFIYQFLKSPIFDNWVERNSKTSAQPNINSREYQSLTLPKPPLSEQHRIAEILSKWDRAIEQVDNLIAAKEHRKKALMQQLLKGKTRVPGFASQNWKERRLGDYFEYFSNRNSEKKQLPVLSCSKVHGIIPQEDKFDKRVASKDTSNYKIVEEGDLVYDPMLLWDGSIGFLKDVQKGVVSPAYYTFKFKGDDLDQVFFEHLLESHYVQYQYEAISQGTNARRQKAPRQAFLGIEVEVPSHAERHAIAEILRKADEELQVLRKERNALQRQKRGMMQKLLTGKVRVSTETTSP